MEAFDPLNTRGNVPGDSSNSKRRPVEFNKLSNIMRNRKKKLPIE